MKLTDSDMLSNEKMLTEVVKRGVEGGAFKEELNKWDRYRLTVYGTKVSFELVKKGKGVLGSTLESFSTYGKRKYSLPDLIADHEFMKAVWGKNAMCVRCGQAPMPIGYGDPPVDSYDFCGKCDVEVKITPGYLYHAIQALKLLHDPEGNAIKYLYDSLPEESCE